MSEMQPQPHDEFECVVRDIITHGGNSKRLDDPYAVAYSKSVEGPITFSLKLWKETYPLRKGDVVFLSNVHEKEVVLRNRQKSRGWRAEHVRAKKPPRPEHAVRSEAVCE